MRVGKYILQLFTGLVLLSVPSSCTRENLETDNGPSTGTGEKVCFAAGTTASTLATKAEGEGISTTPGKTYYMPEDNRFVCRMYYKVGTNDTKFDVSGETDETAWLKVNGTVGNSLYMKGSYATPAAYDVYGNDKDATAFYWQNRKEHAFLAWLDLNKAKTNCIGSSQGSLKFNPYDIIYQKHTGVKANVWKLSGFELYCGGSNREFTSWEDARNFIVTGNNYAAHVQGKLPPELAGKDFSGKMYYYEYGWSCKYCYYYSQETSVDGTHMKRGWVQYQMFYDKLEYQGTTTVGGDIVLRRNTQTEEPAFLYDDANKEYLACIEVNFYKTDADGNLLDPKQPYTIADGDVDATTSAAPERKSITSGTLIKNAQGVTVAKCVWDYYLTDRYGNVKYDETKPRYTFYYNWLYELKEEELVEEYAANQFDLTRGNRASIKDQPDVCQALTIQAPLGATQASNRVNLYFKHQFSQIQVNVKSSADLSVVINRNHIQKVELLGVSEKGYVFTELNEDGQVEPSSYESVDVSKYTDEQLAHNQYGTAFNMFDMYDSTADNDGYALGYIKSYNAITFGQLQAIRITWNEAEDGSGISHESTYHVANETLKNLKSGNKYIWNIELRRGTLAIVRTEIVDWIVPENELEYGTSGTISN